MPIDDFPIKEIVRTLSVSRATVRKVIRGQATEFKYQRGVQPVPKLGEWVTVLTEILAKEAKLPRRERRSTQGLFEELRGRGYDGAHDSVHRPRQGVPVLRRDLPTRHLRQHEDGGRGDLRRQGAAVQPPLSADVFASPDRTGGVHTSVGLGEGAG